MKCLLLVALLWGFSAAQDVDCKAKKEEAKACLDALFGDAKDKWAEKKAQKDACFTDNGCTSPSARFAEVRACKKAAFDKIKPNLESCVRETIPDFAFPEGGHGKGGHRGHKKWGKRGGRKGHGDGDKSAWLAKFCSTPESVQAASQCLQGLRDAHKAAHEGRSSADREAKRNEAKACWNSVPEECKQRKDRSGFAAARSAICACAQKDDNSAFFEELVACRKNDGDADDDDDANDAAELKKKLTEKFCGEGRKGKGRGERREGGDSEGDGEGRRRGGHGHGRRGGDKEDD